LEAGDPVDEVGLLLEPRHLLIRGVRRRDNPLRANFTYLAAPDTTDKKVPRFKKESNLIDGIAGFQPSLLAPFLKALV